MICVDADFLRVRVSSDGEESANSFVVVAAVVSFEDLAC